MKKSAHKPLPGYGIMREKRPTLYPEVEVTLQNIEDTLNISKVVVTQGIPKFQVKNCRSTS